MQSWWIYRRQRVWNLKKMKVKKPHKKIPKHVRTAALLAIKTGKNLEAIETANMIADKINEDSFYARVAAAAEVGPYEAL